MKNAASCFALLLLSAGASACPVSKAVIARYGISDGGILAPPPATAPNDKSGLLHLTLTNASLVSDGFRHILLVDRQSEQAWLRRSGGLAGVLEWYGPIDIKGESLDGCGDDGQRRRDEAGASSKDVAGLSVRSGPTPRTR